MKSGILTIMKKELTRFFTDKRLVFTTILMPGILIYLMYTFMGTAITSMYGPSEEMTEVAVVNLPDSIASVPTGDSMKFVSVDASEVETLKKAVENAEKDILVVFPSDFDEQVAAYRTGFRRRGAECGDLFQFLYDRFSECVPHDGSTS